MSLILERFLWVHSVGGGKDRMGCGNTVFVDGSKDRPYPLIREIVQATLSREEEMLVGKHLHKRVKITIETVD